MRDARNLLILIGADGVPRPCENHILPARNSGRPLLVDQQIFEMLMPEAVGQSRGERGSSVWRTSEAATLRTNVLQRTATKGSRRNNSAVMM